MTSVRVEADEDVYLMNGPQLNGYCSERSAFDAIAGGFPGDTFVLLTPSSAGTWYLVSQLPARGNYRFVRGLTVGPPFNLNLKRHP